MSPIDSELIAQCPNPNCQKPILADHDGPWCSSCGEYLPENIVARIPKLQKKKAEAEAYRNVNAVRPKPSSLATSNVSLAKAKLRAPAIAIIVNAGISLALCLFSFMVPHQAVWRQEELLIAAARTVQILFFPALGFSIYSALQMMEARKHAFAIASAIITILSGWLACIGIPIGIWALIVLLKPEIKSTFADNGMPTA